MKSIIKKTIILSPLSVVLAVLLFQNGFCCAVLGGVCGGSDQVTCCQTDVREGYHAVCVLESGGAEVQDNEIGICEEKEKPEN